MLLEITKTCLIEASTLLAGTQELSQQIRQALEASKAKVDEEEEAGIEEVNGDDSLGHDGVKDYFERHHARLRQQQAETSQTTVDPGACPLSL